MWESIVDGRIHAKACGEEIIIDQLLITRQFGVNVKGVVDATNMLVKEAQIALKNITITYLFMEKK
jgi:hypothetical protein